MGKKHDKSSVENSISQIHVDTVKNVVLEKIDRSFVTGNFYGKETNDTIFTHYYSHIYKTEIDEIPASVSNEWDEIVEWFNQSFQVEIYLTSKADTLFVGPACGFLCFLNIGDVNSDGKDEIAFVADWLDYSQINSCKIYSMCDGKWELLNEFTIHESAFELPVSDTTSNFTGIKGYLEKKNGIWMYSNYDEIKGNASTLRVLHLKRCSHAKRFNIH